jgi:putative transposase
MRLPRVLYPGAVYHVFSRGNNHAALFLDSADREAFLDLLKEVKREFGVRVYAYLLMDNHFHLLIETPGGDLDKAMQRLNQCYTRTFNKRHQRSGHLFENRYKCRLVQREVYLMALIRYIHLAPVKAGTAQSAAEYVYSSHGQYASPRPGSLADWQEVLPKLSANLDRACLMYGEFISKRPGEREWKVLDRKRNGILGDAEFKRSVRTPLPALPPEGEGKSSLATSIKEEAVL